MVASLDVCKPRWLLQWLLLLEMVLLLVASRDGCKPRWLQAMFLLAHARLFVPRWMLAAVAALTRNCFLWRQARLCCLPDILVLSASRMDLALTMCAL